MGTEESRSKPKRLRIKNFSVNLPRNLPSLANQTTMAKGFGGIVIQNWNTKRDIPKELEDFQNLPIIVDKNKLGHQKRLSMLPPIDKNLNDKTE